MFRDNSLMPKEAVRLTALGFLSRQPMRYAELANKVRDFTTRFWGPTLDVMASSLELMRLEGLIDKAADGGDAEVRLTERGRAELTELLNATVRAPSSDFSKLVIALKLRFLDALPSAEQRDQAEALIETRQSELARMIDLRANHAPEGGHFVRWLDHQIASVEADLAWLEGLRDELGGG